VLICDKTIAESARSVDDFSSINAANAPIVTVLSKIKER
jgi:ribosome-associated translation inhibitor RaiA